MKENDVMEEGGQIVPEVWSGDGVIRTNEQMEEWAKIEGCRVEVADSRTLFIDIDSNAAYTVFVDNIYLADRIFGIDKRKSNWVCTPSKSGGEKRHIRVKLFREFSLVERILLQACLGSDLKRELISLKRAMDGEDNVVVFFEKEGG